MHRDLENFLHMAEDQYLNRTEVIAFKQMVAKLQDCYTLYGLLRDQEAALFQDVAEQLVATFPYESSQLLEQALKHWIAVLRYAAMAMLLNNPQYLQHHLLEWLVDIIRIHQIQEIENQTYELLLEQLTATLSSQQMSLISPFLTQAQSALLGDRPSTAKSVSALSSV